eukprot:20233-Heterococcus_DN1.PRE.2
MCSTSTHSGTSRSVERVSLQEVRVCVYVEDITAPRCQDITAPRCHSMLQCVAVTAMSRLNRQLHSDCMQTSVMRLKQQ